MKRVVGWLALALTAAVAANAAAPLQENEPDPKSSGGDAPVVRFGGEVTASYSAHDEGYFNFIDYQRSGLRLFRLNAAAEVRAGDRVSVLTEIRSDNLDTPRPYALYARVRPSLERAISFDVGLIPPVFGSFSRRSYDRDNPLVGYPLAYQYPTILRADAAPATLAGFESARGRGARLFYPVGNPTPASGLPMVNPLKWDTGVAARLGSTATGPVELAAALTQGSVSNPIVEDDNSGLQVASRIAFRPRFEWIVGISGARGAYVSDEVAAEGSQTAVGADAEWTSGYWLVRAEGLFSRWDLPTLDIDPVDALSGMLEARYKLRPGLYVAGRIDHLRFSRIESTWDAPVTRVEAGIGYSLHRQVLVKLSVQHNQRDGGAITSETLPAVQLLVWF